MMTQSLTGELTAMKKLVGGLHGVTSEKDVEINRLKQHLGDEKAKSCAARIQEREIREVKLNTDS